MALIATYSDLQSAVTEYLARDQDTTLIARIPTFIQFAEAKFNRELFVRQMEARSTTTVNTLSSEPEFISLPTDFQSMRRIRLSNVEGKPTLEYKSPAGLDAYRLSIDNVANQPAFFTIFGTEIELAATPNDAFQIEMVYRQNVPPLATNSTNWLLSMAPDLYLYGALLESAPYLKEDSRIQTWVAGFSNALASLNQLSRTAVTFSAGPTRMRLPGATP
jgi:hypothetical protein